MQTIFESIPQLLLQIWMTIRLPQLTENVPKEMDLSLEQIYISIMFSTLNLSMISLQIFSESKMLGLEFVQYVFICLNGRLGFIPFENLLYNSAALKEMEEKPLKLHKI